jgi:RNA polymerase sigma-70 factor, ECF subfamily
VGNNSGLRIITHMADDLSGQNTHPPSHLERVQLLFVRHEAALRVFVRGLQPSLADADDVLQETFLTVSRKADDFREGTNFMAWATRIARYKLLEQARQLRRANALSGQAMEALMEDQPDLESIHLQERALASCVARLTQRMRELLVQRYVGRRTSEQIGTAMAMTPLAVRVALSKARTLLRDCVAGELRHTS